MASMTPSIIKGLTAMDTNDKCPHCGSAKLEHWPFYNCGTNRLKNVRSRACIERAASSDGKCPHCGADKDTKAPHWYWCGTHESGVQSPWCKERKANAQVTEALKTLAAELASTKSELECEQACGRQWQAQSLEWSSKLTAANAELQREREKWEKLKAELIKGTACDSWGHPFYPWANSVLQFMNRLDAEAKEGGK